MFGEHECRRCRQDFPALEATWNGRPVAYLDGPAGTQVPRQVIDAISGYYLTANANTHGQFETSRRSDELVESVRTAAAAFLGAEEGSTISFGANMTTLAFALARALGRCFRAGDEIVVTRLDHEANRGPWMGLRELGLVVREVALGADGRLDVEDFERQVTARTRLVAIGAASNALGTVNDLALARRLARNAGALLLVDAVHYAAHLPVDVQAIGADFLFCSAYKFYGPHVGLLYTRPGLLDTLATDRLITQDPQAPWRIETGTLNHAAIAGVGAAIEYLASWGEGATLRDRLLAAMGSIAAYEHELARHYHEGVLSIPGAKVHGPPFVDGELRAPTVSITLEGHRPEAIAAFLGEHAIQVWDGHFYAARAIEDLGLDAGGGVLRTGVVMYNNRAELDRLLEGLDSLARSA